MGCMWRRPSPAQSFARPCRAQADVTIRVETALSSWGERGVMAQAEGADRFLLAIPGVAAFHVHGGREIIIQPAPQADAAAIRLFLLGSAFGALLHQRGITPMHGSAVALPRRGDLQWPPGAWQIDAGCRLCRARLSSAER